MGDLQQRLIDILVESGALLRGDFTLKSGEHSDYFIDFGAIAGGLHLERLGECYAEMIEEKLGLGSFDVIFGPPYKAIPIATVTATAIYRRAGVDKRYAFNRKEAKHHGDARQFVGAEPQSTDRILIVDDVFSDGGAKLETLRLLKAGVNPEVVGVLVGVDRSRPGARERFAEQSGGVPVHAICGMDEVRRLARFDALSGA